MKHCTDFLWSCNVGVTVHSVCLSATQCADTQVFLLSATALPAFIPIVDRMAAASVERVNLQKSKLPLVGRKARQQCSSLLVQHSFGSLQVTPVQVAHVLGIIVGSAAPVDWGAHVQGVESCSHMSSAYSATVHIWQGHGISVLWCERTALCC